MISFTVGYFFLCFPSVFRIADNVAARIVCESEAAAGRVLRTTGAAATCIRRHFFTICIELQLVILKNTTGTSDLTLYVTITVTIGFYFF